MNDREMLELAAKAAGITLWWDGDSPKELVHHWSGNPEDGGEERDYPWNPLTDDGDALRLAVSLWLLVDSDEHLGESEAMGMGVRQRVAHEADKYAATRRAIVIAAAEIGRAM